MMKVSIVRRNERSWAIDLISKINSFVHKNDLVIKRAGGENSISTGIGSTMFPDVILYGNDAQSVILQGWELKMPDVPIEDETFIKDAQRKARALNLNSCLIWNFTYAVLYVRDASDRFHIVKQWSDTSYIRTRDDVQKYRSAWEQLLEEILLEVNQYFLSGEFRQTSISDVISNTAITALVQRNKELVAEELRKNGFHDSVLTAYIDNWWQNVRAEYEHDETDKYNAYAKTVILNWANRVLFAHIIKKRQNAAMRIDELDFDSSPTDGNSIFAYITSKCDFYNVFSPMRYDSILPSLAWQDIVELSLFLKEHGVEQLDQVALQNVLEGSVSSTKREINGQFTTPPELAHILAKITVRDWSQNIIDCCCGTGTISNAALKIKKELSDSKTAVETVWASDKNKYPLQVANISMTNADTVNLANRIFQHNALDLSSGEIVKITNPETGELMEITVPEFGAVISNLPFVPFEIIPSDDKDLLREIPYACDLDGRSDLYCYIALAIEKFLQPSGYLGIITSNSWLGTNAGHKLIAALEKVYTLRQVHISGRGRWFKNADVVTTILILQKKPANKEYTQFFLWQKSLSELAEQAEAETTLINSALLEQELDTTVVKVSTYAPETMSALLSLNVSYNALFHKVEWLLTAQDKIIPIGTVFHVFRGSRRGWDAMFYPKAGEHNIEKEFLKKVLINARKVNRLETVAEADAFCCSYSINELKEKGAWGALAWIDKFKAQRNGVGKPLPEVLKKSNMYWYELQDSEIAEVFTAMNPDQRLFFARFPVPSFVNQRLIGLRHKSTYSDQELNHALLNSMFTMFYIEASGFGRGLGVLDINKDSIAKCYMLNPQMVSPSDRKRILDAFNVLKGRDIKKVSEELFERDREIFEHIVLESFGIDDLFEDIRSSLLSMQKARSAALE